MKTARALVLVGLGYLASAVGAEEAWSFQYQFETGKVWRGIEARFTSFQMVQIGSLLARMGIVVRSEVQSVSAEGVATLVVTYERVDSSTSRWSFNVSGETHADTASPEPTQSTLSDLAQSRPVPGDHELLARALGGTRFEVDITPAGQVTAVRGAEALRQRAIAMIKLDPSPQAGGLAGLVTELYSDRTFTARFQAIYGSLPDRAVKVGDSWEKPVSLPSTATIWMTPAALTATYTLAAVEPDEHGHQIATINFKLQGDRDRLGQMTVMGHKGAGSLRFDLSAGQLVDRWLRMEGAWDASELEALEVPSLEPPILAESYMPAREDALTAPIFREALPPARPLYLPIKESQDTRAGSGSREPDRGPK